MKYLILIILFFPIIIFSQEKLNGIYNKEYKIFLTKNTDSIYLVDKFKNGKGVFFYKENINLTKLLNNQYETKELGKCGLIDSTGQILLPIDFDNITIINDSIAKLNNENKYWLYNLRQKKSISKKYESINYFQNEKIAFATLNGMYGVINLNGKEITPFEYSWFLPIIKHFLIAKKGEYYGGLTMSGKPFLPFIYKYIESGSNYIIAQKKIGFDIFDKTGQFITNLNYTKVRELENNFFAVEDYYRTYLYDLKNKKIISSESYADLAISDYFDKNKNIHIRALENGKNKYKSGFIDYQENIVLPIIYEIGNFENGFATIGKDSKYGLIDENKKIVVSLIFDGIGGFHDNIAEAIYNGKYVFINTKGEILFEKEKPKTIYDELGFFNEGLAREIRNKKYGFFNKSGINIIALKFDWADNFSNGTALVLKNKTPYFIDRNGKRIEL